jgi:hypothetical protein
MVVNDYLDYIRRQLDDTVEPYRWSLDDLIFYYNSILKEFCDETLLLTDFSTAVDLSFKPLCSLDTVIGNAEYEVSDRILRLHSVTLDDGSILSSIDYDSYIYLSKNEVSEKPRHYSFINNTLFLYPIPDDVYTIKMYLSRLPLKYITESELYINIEIPDKWTNYLDPGIYKLAYDKHDSDTYDPNMVIRYNTEWNRNKEIIKERDILNTYIPVKSGIYSGLL